jgi:hypothetical protein
LIEQFSSGTKSNIPKKRKRNNSQSSLTEEFKKAKPPTFDGEINKGEEVEAWYIWFEEVLFGYTSTLIIPRQGFPYLT